MKVHCKISSILYRFFIYLCCSLLLCQISFAQKYELGAGTGFMVYFGDLNSGTLEESLQILHSGGQFFIKSQLVGPISVRANILVGKVSGNDALSPVEWRKMRNLSFTSSIFEMSGILEWSFFRVRNNKFNEDVVRVYVLGGIGVFRFNPKAKIDNIEYTLQALGTEGQGMPGFSSKYKLWSGVLPLGGGIDIRLSDRWILTPEIGIRYTMTDYLDDVSTSYVNYFELRAGNGDLAARLANRTGEYLGQSEPVILPTGTQRGNPGANDIYFTAMVHLVYRFFDNHNRGKTQSCPTFK